MNGAEGAAALPRCLLHLRNPTPPIRDTEVESGIYTRPHALFDLF